MFVALSERARYDTTDGVLPHPAVDHSAAGTSAARPDLEWTISQFNLLRTKVGAPAIDPLGIEPWAMNIAAFAGSFQDDGIGEDFLPNDAPFVRVDFACSRYDVCDVCGGFGNTCLDCFGGPNGPATYDICDVGNGAG